MALLFGVMWVAPARAHEPLVVRGDDCLTSESVRAGVRSWLGRDPFVPGELEVRVDAGPPTRFELVRGDDVAERVFPTMSGRCEERVAALTLALALALDDTLLSRLELDGAAPSDGAEAPEGEDTDVAERSRPEVVQTTAPALAPPRPATASARGAEGAEGADLGAWVRLGVGVELTRRPAFLGRAQLHVDRGLLSLGLGWSATQVRARRVASGRVEARRMGADVSGCVVGPASSRWRPFACGAALAARVRARGIGFAEDRRIGRPWLALGATVGLRVALTPSLDVHALASGWGAIMSPRLEVRGGDELVGSWTLPRIGTDLQIGLGVRFW